MEEAVLHAHAHNELVGVDPTLKKTSDSWLARLVASCEEYAMELILVGSPMDGLFPLLVANFTKLDIMVAHHQGLWSSKAAAQGSVEDDIFLVFTNCGFSRLLPGVPDLSSQQGLTLQDPDEGWSTVPPKLNAPITDIQAVSQATGYIPKPDQPPISLTTFLSNLVGVPIDEYRPMLLEWMTAHHKVSVVQQWLNDHGSMWTQYRDHLLSGWFRVPHCVHGYEVSSELYPGRSFLVNSSCWSRAV